MAQRLKISVGSRYNRWVVVKEIESHIQPNGKSCRKFLCKCDCGKEKEVLLYTLRNRKSKSCGCLMREVNKKLLIERSTTHGYTTIGNEDRSLYFVLNTIKQRCYNENSEKYLNYGAKGIEVCKEWRDNFVIFRNWAYDNGYVNQPKNIPFKDKLSIDRINPDGNYCPENCQWITISENTKKRFTDKL